MYCFNSTSNPTIHCSRASHVSITPLPSMPPPLPLIPTEQPFERGASCSWTAATMWKPPNLSPDQKTGVWPPWAQHWTPTLPNTFQHWAAAWCISSASAHHSLPHTCYLTTRQPTYQPILFRLEFKSIFYRQHWQPITNTQKTSKSKALLSNNFNLWWNLTY